MKLENQYFIFDDPEGQNRLRIIKQVLAAVLRPIYKVLTLIAGPRELQEKKYKVAICAIFRDEAPYMKEWIEFHKIVGVDHFYLYNNFSSDDYLTVLKPYIEGGVCDAR